MNRLAAALVGLCTLLTYLWSAGPTFYWLDSSELTAAAWGLGVAHPPGHPLASLLGRLACLVPVGTLSFRVSLAGAVEAAAAAALLTLLTHRLLAPQTLLGPVQRSACAAVTGLTLGLSYSVWFQAVRAEVYALNLLLLVAIVHELLAWEQDTDRRRLLCAALLTGLALCNHHLLALLLLPVVLLFLLWSSRARRAPNPTAAKETRAACSTESKRGVRSKASAPGPRRVVALTVAAGLLGLCTLAYLPLRSRRLPEVDWGAPRTLPRFVWTVSARAFQQSVTRAARQPLAVRVGGAGFAVIGGLGPVAAMIALGGLYLLWRRRETRCGALLLTGGVGTNLLSAVLVGFDPLNPDAHGYLAVGVALLAPGVGVLLAEVAQLFGRWRRGGAFASAALLLAAGLLPLYQARSARSDCDLRHHWAAEETSRAQLQAPPGALLVTSFFETLFNAWALRVTADARPDLAIVHRHFLGQPGYLEDLRRRDPELGAAASGWASGAGPRPDDLDQIAARRAVLVEIDPDLAPALQAHLGPAGLLPRWRGPRTAMAQQQHLDRVLAWRSAVGPPEENETRRALVWIHFTLAAYGCAERLPELARRHLQWAGELAPHDRRLAALAKSCGFPTPPRRLSPR